MLGRPSSGTIKWSEYGKPQWIQVIRINNLYKFVEIMNGDYHVLVLYGLIILL